MPNVALLPRDDLVVPETTTSTSVVDVLLEARHLLSTAVGRDGGAYMVRTRLDVGALACCSVS